jgi:signal peptidase II
MHASGDHVSETPDPSRNLPQGETPPPASPPNPSELPPTAPPAAPLAWRSPAAWIRFILPAILGLALDLSLKSWAFPDGVPADEALRHAAGRNPATLVEPQTWIPHVLGFTTTVNEGAVFGIGQGHVLLFLVFSIFALAVILWIFLTSPRKQWIVHIALGLITAGAIGNLYDRALFGGVRDMLRFYVHWYPYIFNIADVCLCVGVPLLIVRWLLVPEPKPEKMRHGFDVETSDPH